MRIRMAALALAWGLSMAGSLTAQTGYFGEMVKDAKTRITEISADRLAALRKEDPSLVVVDVREDTEWERGRIPGAIHVGRGVLEPRIEARVPDKATPVVVYCQLGWRSAVAADVLMKMGYKRVFSLAGGIAAYAAGGLPVDNAGPAK